MDHGAIRLGPGQECIERIEREQAEGFERLVNFLEGATMNPTRCKMKLTSISEAYNNGVTVKFAPVTSGSEENKTFYAATPSGSIEFTVSAAAKKSLGLDLAKLGSEFYVDFTPADPAPAA